MLEMCRSAGERLTLCCLGLCCAAPAAGSEEIAPQDVEARLHAIFEHNNLADDAFLANQFGMRMRVEADGAGDLRGILQMAPDFAFASGFSYTIRHDNRSGKDEVRLGFLFQQCPDEARFVNDWKMPPVHLRLGDGSGSVTRFASADNDSVSFSLIYQSRNGICEAAFSQKVPPRPRVPLNPPPANHFATPFLPNALADIMRGGDLRNHGKISSALQIPFSKIAFRHTEKSAGNGLLLAGKVSPGIDSEMFSYVIQDTGWQPLYPFSADPEILVNRRASLHIPLDYHSSCISEKQIEAALTRAGVRTTRSQPGRNVLQWETRGENTLALLATRHGKCIEAFDFTQLTDTDHALPETPIFKLPSRFTAQLATKEDKNLVMRIAYRLRNEAEYTLDFMAQLPANAQLAEFERMDTWLSTLHTAFEAAGVAPTAMESHLYPPAAAGTPPRVFLVVVRASTRCGSAERGMPEPIMPSATPCH